MGTRWMIECMTRPYRTEWERLQGCSFTTAKKAAKYATSLMAERDDQTAFRLIRIDQE